MFNHIPLALLALLHICPVALVPGDLPLNSLLACWVCLGPRPPGSATLNGICRTALLSSFEPQCSQSGNCAVAVRAAKLQPGRSLLDEEMSRTEWPTLSVLVSWRLARNDWSSLGHAQSTHFVPGRAPSLQCPLSGHIHMKDTPPLTPKQLALQRILVYMSTRQKSMQFGMDLSFWPHTPNNHWPLFSVHLGLQLRRPPCGSSQTPSLQLFIPSSPAVRGRPPCLHQV